MDDLDELASRLNSAAVHLTRRLRLTDRELGVSPARLSALSVLVFGGAQTLSSLANVEQVTAPTMSRIVRGLERDGLVERRPHGGDARAIRLTATAKGRRLMERGRARRVEQLARRLRALPADDVRQLARAIAILEDLEQRADR